MAKRNIYIINNKKNEGNDKAVIIPKERRGAWSLTLVSFILLIVLDVFIWIFSAMEGDVSSSASLGLAEFILNYLHLNIPEFILRKLGHVTEYFLMGILVLGLWRAHLSVMEEKTKAFLNPEQVKQMPAGIVEKSMILLSATLIFLSATVDEIHQSYVPGRNSSIIDVFLDTISALVAIWIINFIVRKRSKA